MTKEIVFRKIQKLLAMIEDGTNENEVKVAQNKLFILLNKHRDINIDSLKNEEIIQHTHYTGKKRINHLHSLIFQVCSKFCGCFFVYASGRGKYFIYGKQRNIDDALYLSNNLYSQIDRRTESWWKANKAKFRGESTRVIKRSYTAGLVDSVCDRLYEITKGHIEYNGEKGLVCVNDSVAAYNEANDYFHNKLCGTVKTQNNNSPVFGCVYGQGCEEGKDIGLHGRVEGPESALMLESTGMEFNDV